MNLCTHTGAPLLVMLSAGMSLSFASPAMADDYLHSVVLNEMMSENASTIYNEALGEYSDWIELYNGSDATIDLSGYFLTDDLNNTTKHQIASGVTIAPGEHLLFWADGHPELGPMHIGFKLDNDGEVAGLFAPLHAGNHRIDAVAFPAMAPDQSYGRSCDAFAGWRRFQTDPSPLAPNTGECIFVCNEADFNDDRSIDFFDVSIFVMAIASSDPLADLNGDGSINFFDISLFLTLYQSGCNAQ